MLYIRALDLRLCTILARLEAGISPCSTPAALLAKLRARPSGIVLVDVDTELAAGIDLVRSLAHRLGGMSLVPVCMHGSIDFFRECFHAGASDVLDKSFGDERIRAALAAAIASTRHQREHIDRRRRRLRYAILSEREREVFCYILDGHTNQEVADLLSLSRRTVEVHRASIQRKLEVRNVAQMASLYAGFR